MPTTHRQRLKEALIGLGVYRPVRRFYDRFVAPNHTLERRKNMEFFSRFVGPGDLCFDVGANVGRKTGALLQLGARVVAFEPQPVCQRELAVLYGDHPEFRLVPKAVGRAPGKTRMHLASSSGLSSLRADWLDQWESEVDIEVTTLDEAIAVHGVPRLVKIDVEGFELEVLSGLTRPIEWISLEYNVRYLDQTLACVDHLAGSGEIRLNMTLREEIQLQWEQWCPREDFPARFRAELDRNEGSWWGDVFVKTTLA